MPRLYKRKCFITELKCNLLSGNFNWSLRFYWVLLIGMNWQVCGCVGWIMDVIVRLVRKPVLWHRLNHYFKMLRLTCFLSYELTFKLSIEVFFFSYLKLVFIHLKKKTNNWWLKLWDIVNIFKINKISIARYYFKALFHIIILLDCMQWILSTYQISKKYIRYLCGDDSTFPSL